MEATSKLIVTSTLGIIVGLIRVGIDAMMHTDERYWHGEVTGARLKQVHVS